MNNRVGCIACWQACMAGLAPSPSPSPKASLDNDDEDGASSSGDDQMMTFQWIVLCHLWQKGGGVSSFEGCGLVFRGRVSIGHFFDRGSVYSFQGCSEVYMYFSFFLVTLASCIQVFWPFFIMTYIVLYFLIYDDDVYSFSLPTSTCVVSFLSLYMCFFVYAIFISISYMMPWWVLLKYFRKTGCESLSCHELFSCKVFQELVVGIDLFCNNTSGYEFSDLKLLSWLFVLLWFCHSLPKGKIVRDIFM